MFINSTNRPLPTGAELMFVRYANDLEEATNYSFELAYDKDEECPQFWLIDPCGDREGDCWDSFQDFKFDTEGPVNRYFNKVFNQEMEAEAIPMAHLV
jgi:hypothetical protein